MSVIVHGVNDPPNCRNCPFEVFDRCGALSGALLPINYSDYTERPDFCPLEPLPVEHGELIDLDSAMEFWEELFDKDGKPVYAVRNRVLWESPVIIKAEGSKPNESTCKTGNKP